jgi:hypothetical protein
MHRKGVPVPKSAAWLLIIAGLILFWWWLLDTLGVLEPILDALGALFNV